MNSVEKSAKTVAEAIADALAALGINENEADITVLDEGKKGGFLGFGAKNAMVSVKKKPDIEALVKSFLREVTLSMGLDVKIETSKREKHLNINLTGDNMGILIGKRGQTLDALQYVTNLVINKYGTTETSVILDTENYRKRRRDTLEALARNIARKVRDKKTSVKLEPMSRFERHVIHTTLQNDRSVRTYSEGNEPYRNVVIAPKTDK